MTDGVPVGESERPRDVAAARRLLVRRLQAAGVPSPEADAVLLLEGALGVDRATLLLQPDRPVGKEAGARLAEMLRRRVAREPLQLILGRAHFYGLELAVTPGVLIPRPETERLVELVLLEARGAATEDEAATLLDVGTGSGAVALALKAEWPAATVWGSDVSHEAVSLARRNAGDLQLPVTFRLSDLLADPDVAHVAARCTALVSNPPYLPESDRQQVPPEVNADPGTALFAGPDGLAVARRLARQAFRILPGGALLALELDPRNVHEFAGSLVGWKGVRVERDLAGRQRFVLARR